MRIECCARLVVYQLCCAIWWHIFLEGFYHFSHRICICNGIDLGIGILDGKVFSRYRDCWGIRAGPKHLTAVCWSKFVIDSAIWYDKCHELVLDSRMGFGIVATLLGLSYVIFLWQCHSLHSPACFGFRGDFVNDMWCDIRKRAYITWRVDLGSVWVWREGGGGNSRQKELSTVQIFMRIWTRWKWNLGETRDSAKDLFNVCRLWRHIWKDDIFSLLKC